MALSYRLVEATYSNNTKRYIIQWFKKDFLSSLFGIKSTIKGEWYNVLGHTFSNKDEAQLRLDYYKKSNNEALGKIEPVTIAVLDQTIIEEDKNYI